MLSTRLKPLSNLVEAAGYLNYGPDPDLALSKYKSKEEAAQDILYVIKRVVEIVEKQVKPRLEEEKLWSKEHQEALEKLRQLIKATIDPHEVMQGRARRFTAL